jgi:hypothetical protein
MRPEYPVTAIPGERLRNQQGYRSADAPETAVPGGGMPGISQVGPLPDQAESATEWAQPSPRQIAQICITATLIEITAGTCA